METRKRWTIVIFGIMVPLIIGISAELAALDYPTRYIDFVIPYGPGGGTDVTVRLYKDKLEKVTLGRMKKFCESLASKDERIDSKYISYIEDFKAIAKS